MPWFLYIVIAATCLSSRPPANPKLLQCRGTMGCTERRIWSSRGLIRSTSTLKWGTVDLCQTFTHSLLNGSGSYELTGDAAEIGEGPLSISVSVRFACLIQVYTAAVYVAIATNGTTPVRWVVRLISQQRELKPHTAASVQGHIVSILYYIIHNISPHLLPLEHFITKLNAYHNRLCILCCWHSSSKG